MSHVATDPNIAGTNGSGGIADDMLTTADGVPLKVSLGRAQARSRRRAFFLVLPLLAFLLITFVSPIAQMLNRAIYNPDFPENMVELTAWFKANPRGSEINEQAYGALATDLKSLRENFTAGTVGTRVNYEMSGTRSLFTSSARDADRLKPPYKEALLAMNSKWDSARLWEVMREVSSAYTPNFLLAALDLTRTATGGVTPVNPERQIYVSLYLRTLQLSALITLITLILGFPIAHLLATLPLRRSNMLMIFVLLPFWTSLLVRTTAWIVLLQSQGVINDLLVWLGLITDQGRVQLIYNKIGTIIAMTHILLPFMVLPLYSVMRSIDPSYTRAARSLGATSWTAFRRIYLPQTLPGMGAGALLVFIMAVGYYITPALVGGASGQLISNMIAYHMQDSLNWSLAAALAAILLVGVLILYWLYDRIVGIDKLKLG
ncbi:ABC-type spermidine/putrescine transport system, permease component I [hydrothermal vent metagenome]|uniref:ABC-type spermidine/putrescine transport system, permease component I n=1 Tax=hydrothermal vent metagenome TaxID=652676 RepID=A0A3B0U3P3_9ZZZZ